MSEDAVPDNAREEVVSAVRLALSRHGYANLTTKKVAAASQKSEAFFFYHYDTKDDLVVAFLDWAIERTTDRLDGLGSADPVVRLYAAVGVLLGDPSDEVFRGINVAMMELLSHAPYNDRFRDRLIAFERSVLETLADIIRDGREAGAFRDVDPEATAAFVLMTTDGTAGAVMALGMTDVAAGVRDRLAAYLGSTVLAPDVDPPAAGLSAPG
jgi:AcrR family transcriptional regulator